MHLSWAIRQSKLLKAGERKSNNSRKHWEEANFYTAPLQSFKRETITDKPPMSSRKRQAKYAPHKLLAKGTETFNLPFPPLPEGIRSVLHLGL